MILCKKNLLYMLTENIPGRISAYLQNIHYKTQYVVYTASVFFFTSLLPLCQSNHTENIEQTIQFEENIKNGDFASFLSIASKSPFYRSSRNELMYNLDAGLAEVFHGNHQSGLKKLMKVGDISEKYYTKSISTGVLSVLTNDLVLPYYGEDYEVTFAGNVAALAFAAQGKFDEALVEIRKSEHRLSVISDAYEGSDKYSDDGLAHYIAGMLYEITGNYNDAAVSYKLARKTYGSRFFPMVPDGLAKALSRSEIAAGLSDINPDSSSHHENIPEKSTLLLVFAFTGRGPVKHETIVRAHFTNEGIDHIIKIALPEIKKRESSICSVRLKMDNQIYYPEYTADYSHIGTNTFNDKKALIYTKTLARVSARYLILKAAKENTIKKLKEKYEKAKEKHGEDSTEADTAWLRLKAASFGLDMLANELLEHADTRGSLLLPGRVYSARIPVREGIYTIIIEYLNTEGFVIGSEMREIEANAQQGSVQIYTALY